MTIHAEFGWWLLPLGFTALAGILCIAVYQMDIHRKDTPRLAAVSHGRLVDAVIRLTLWSALITVTLIAWLVWAVLS